MDSRVASTRALGNAISRLEHPPKVWLNSSTATIYRHSEDKAMDEKTGEIGTGFSVNVATTWEETFFNAQTPNTRKVALRTAITLGDGGGAYVHFKGLTKVGFGGNQGSGKQMVSWVHQEDLYRAILFLIEGDMVGTVNISSPNPITNHVFMGAFRQEFKPFLSIPTKTWMLTIGAFVLRTETELLLKSRWVIPGRLHHAGFQFRFDTIQKAVSDLH